MKRTIIIMVAVLFGVTLSYYTGMFGGPHSGRVMNSLTQAPIEGARVRVYFIGMVPGPGHSNSKTIKEINTITNENGRYFTLPWIGLPKGLFISRRAHATAGKSGFVYSRGRYRFRTDAIYLVPEAEAVMEAMRDWWWAAENSILLDSTSTNPDKVSEFNDNVWRYEQYVGAYYEAKKIAKTERELQFLAELCDRVLKFYERITWTQKLEQERVERCGDRCSYEELKKCKLEGKRGR